MVCLAWKCWSGSDLSCLWLWGSFLSEWDAGRAYLVLKCRSGQLGPGDVDGDVRGGRRNQSSGCGEGCRQDGSGWLCETRHCRLSRWCGGCHWDGSSGNSGRGRSGSGGSGS